MTLKRKIYALAYLFLIFVMANQLSAFELNGRFSSEIYTYEEGDQFHVRPYQSLRANATIWKNQKQRLTFHTYSRFMTDLGDKKTSDPQFSLYTGYFALTGYPRNTRAYLGRQFVYTSAGSALIDGLKANYRLSRRWKIETFAGSAVSQTDPEKVQSFSNFSVIGGRVNFKHQQFNTGLNWMQKKSDGHIAYNRLGLNIGHNRGDMYLYGRYSLNIAKRKTAEFLARASMSKKSWYLSTEYLHREPSVSANSIFSLIQSSSYDIIRLNGRKKLNAKLSLFSSFQTTLMTDESSQNISLGVSSRYYSVGWQIQDGYSGESSGLFGSFNLRYGQYDLFGGANINRYKIQLTEKEQSDSYSTRIGISRRFSTVARAEIEGQFMRNANRADDLRLYARLTVGFTAGGKE